jgi:hypothetical protein
MASWPDYDNYIQSYTHYEISNIDTKQAPIIFTWYSQNQCKLHYRICFHREIHFPEPTHKKHFMRLRISFILYTNQYDVNSTQCLNSALIGLCFFPSNHFIPDWFRSHKWCLQPIVVTMLSHVICTMFRKSMLSAFVEFVKWFVRHKSWRERPNTPGKMTH